MGGGDITFSGDLPREMTEIELANSLSGNEIVKNNIHFTDPEAKRISILKVSNHLKRACDDFLDGIDTPPKKKHWYSFILRRLK